jgi:tetratricopeptide (TPR) repeat protein
MEEIDQSSGRDWHWAVALPQSYNLIENRWVSGPPAKKAPLLIRKLPRRTEGNLTLPDLCSFIDSSPALHCAIAGRISQGLGLAFLSVLALMLLAPAPAAQETLSAKSEGATLHGTVHDRSGRLVSDAHVVLQEVSSRIMREGSTDSAGVFTITGVAMGSFTLTADAGPLRSAAFSLIVSAPGEQPPIDVILDASEARQSVSAPGDASQAMQFADKPDFAIAAVTDWTAVGGHGSDASLRTSEALTREAVKLEPQGAQPAAAELPAGGNEAKESESKLRAAVEKNPKDFGANHRLGLLYLEAGRYQDAVPPLQAASQTDPSDYDNEFELAQALEGTGDSALARDHVRRLRASRPTAALHRMEGALDERLEDPLSAVQEFREAASEEPSEDNYFAWGSELLIHRAVWQAKEVFDRGVTLYPQSARLLTARGAALFAGALYDQAALDLCKASDLNPDSLEPYLFIGKIETAAPNPLPCVVVKLAQFERLQPANSLANYYYAMALWKQQGETIDPQILGRVKDLLTRAVTLDPKCADASLQLGNLSAGEKQWEQAIGHYLNAIHADPELSEAHYRLGVAYERAGEQAKAKEQFQLHDALASEQAAEIQRQRKAVKQFLVVSPDQVDKRQAR